MARARRAKAEKQARPYSRLISSYTSYLKAKTTIWQVHKYQNNPFLLAPPSGCVCVKVLFVLFEHAAGYAIFRCRDVEDIGSLLPEVQASMTDFSLFSSTVTLEAFSPFKTGANALENINAVSEGMAETGGEVEGLKGRFLLHCRSDARRPPDVSPEQYSPGEEEGEGDTGSV